MSEWALAEVRAYLLHGLHGHNDGMAHERSIVHTNPRDLNAREITPGAAPKMTYTHTTTHRIEATPSSWSEHDMMLAMIVLANALCQQRLLTDPHHTTPVRADGWVG